MKKKFHMENRKQLKAQDNNLITKVVNLLTTIASEEILSKPNITSHSVRIGLDKALIHF